MAGTSTDSPQAPQVRHHIARAAAHHALLCEMDRGFDAGFTQSPLETGIERLAAAQFGLVSRTQAKALGLTNDILRRRLDSGRWESIHRDVFRIAGAPISLRQRMLAACLGWGPDALISFNSAMRLWELPGTWGDEPQHIIVDRGRRRSDYPARRHWLGPLPRGDITAKGPIPVTTVSRTFVDVAGCAPSEELEDALDDALRRRLTSIPRMRRQLEAAGRRKRVAILRALLDARDPTTRPPESLLETKVARILRSAKLTGLVAQHNIVVEGHVIARVDFAIPTAKVAVEADGYRWHSDRAQWQRDLERRNALTNLGWRIIHITWDDLSRPQAIIDQVEQALRARFF
jgi:very-short-patch-repair endonuclease